MSNQRQAKATDEALVSSDGWLNAVRQLSITTIAITVLVVAFLILCWFGIIPM